MTKKIKKFLLGIALASSTVALGTTFIVANKQKIENSKQNFQYRNLANNYKVGEDLSNVFFDYFENLEMDEIKNTISFENKDNINFLSTYNQNKSKTEIIFAKDSNKAKIKVIDKKTNKISKSFDVEINFYIDDLDIEIIYNNKSYKKSEIESGLFDLKANLGAITNTTGAALGQNLAPILEGMYGIETTVVSITQNNIIKDLGDKFNYIGDKISDSFNWFIDKLSPAKKNLELPLKTLPLVEEVKNYIVVKGTEGSIKIPKMKVEVQEVAIAAAVASNKIDENKYYLSFFYNGKSFLSMININKETAKNVIAFSGTKKTVFKKNKYGESFVDKREQLNDKTHWNNFITLLNYWKLKYINVYTKKQEDAFKLAKNVTNFLESKNYFDVVSGGKWEVSPPELHGKYKDREFWHYHVQKKTSEKNISYRKNSHILYGLTDNTEYYKKQEEKNKKKKLQNK